MSRNSKALLILSSAIAPILVGASAYGSVTFDAYSPAGYNGNWWPSASNGPQPTSASGFNPTIVSGNNGAVGAPDNAVGGPETLSPGKVEAETFLTGSSGFNLGEIALVFTGGGATTLNFNLFQLTTSPTSGFVNGASTGYSLGGGAEAAGTNELLGGGSGASVAFGGTGGSVEEFTFSGADNVALLPNTEYAFEIWNTGTGSEFLERTSGAQGQPYTNGAVYSATGAGAQVDHSTVARGQVAGVLENLTFAIYPGPTNSTWTDGNADNTWSTGSDWTSGVPTNAGDVANFTGGLATSATTANLNGTSETVGKINFNQSSYTIAPGTGGSLTLDNKGVNAQINDLFNNQAITAPITLNSTAQIAVGQTTNVLTLSGNISGAGGITLNQTSISQSIGTVVLSGANSYLGNTTVNTGTLVINPTSTANTVALPATALSIGATAVVRLADNASASTPFVSGSADITNQLLKMSSLTITAGGVLDIRNNHFNVADPGGAPDDANYTTLLSDMQSGAITSTYSQGLPGYGIGVVDGNDGVSGSPVSSGQIEVAYTLQGDANLDGRVDATDFGIFAPNFGATGFTLGWEGGDFNYSGTVDATDFGLFAPNFGSSDSGTAISLPSADVAALDAFAAANGLSLTSVPEPASLGLLTLGVVGILSRRRRNNPRD